MSLLLRNALLLDVASGDHTEGDLRCEDGRIVESGPGLKAPQDARGIDLRGAHVMPGLIDAHVHVTASTADLGSLPSMSPSYLAAHSARLMGQMLERGFTTVRDASGADYGLADAQAEGLIRGPRLLFCGVELFLRKDAFLVPTLVTYWALEEEGMAFGLPEASWRKVDEVLEAGFAALERAASAGVRLVYGSDLLGGMHRHQSEELRLRARVQSPKVLRAATVNAAELVGMAGSIGTLTVGAHADLLVLDGDPTRDIGALAKPKNLRYVVQSGEVVSASA
ncbi:amidohydrolase family protein [Nonomuraea dietziae]|uniref:amidohydrolase family protein n=1 Tax=Nonomuraea dietziae TaxID=65515 RepID=UPI003434BA56